MGREGDLVCYNMCEQLGASGTAGLHPSSGLSSEGEDYGDNSDGDSSDGDSNDGNSGDGDSSLHAC